MLSCWWCCYFLGLFFVGAVNFRVGYFLAGWFFVGCCFLWCDGFWWFFGCCKVWGWFQFLGLWFLGLVSVPFLLVSVLLDAVRCDFLGLGVFGFLALGWFVFLAFCRVLPVCTVANIADLGVFVGGLLFGSLALCCLFLYFQKLLNRCGFLSGVSWLFCNGFILLFYIFPSSPILSNVFIFCRVFSGIFIAIYYKLIGANDGLSSFGAFELANFHYKKVLENLTNRWRLCIIISSVRVGGSTAGGSTAQTTTHKGTHHTQPRRCFYILHIETMGHTQKLQELLGKLESHDIYLYDNGTALYFMHTPTERKTRFFRNDSKNLTETLVEFCEKLLAKLEA